MNEILNKIAKEDIITSLLNKEGRFVVPDAINMAFLAAAAYQKKPQKIMIVAPNLYMAQNIYEHLGAILGEDKCLFFPEDEVLRIDSSASSKEILMQRLEVMEKSLQKEPRILICHIASMTRFLPSVEQFSANKMTFEIGKTYNQKEIIEQLVSSSFVKVNKIDSSLQFALRGDILDIYPFDFDDPIRIEFFDDEIESIRYFHVEDQISFKNVKKIEISPSSDLIFSPNEKENGIKSIISLYEKEKNDLDVTAQEKLKDIIDIDIANIKDNNINENLYKYYSFFGFHTTIISYFKPELSIMFDAKGCRNAWDFMIKESFNYFSELNKSGLCLKGLILHDDYLSLISENHFVNCYKDDLDSGDLSLKIRPIVYLPSSINKVIELITNYNTQGNKVIVALKENQFETFIEYLQDRNVKYEILQKNTFPTGDLGITKMPLEEGFELYEEHIVYLSGKEIFGYKPRLTRFLHRYKEAVPLKSYEELEPGDYVVHEENGIGQFESIVTLLVLGIHKDYLKIKYAGKDVLFVPLEQFKLVRKYVSKEGAVPKINKLGSTEWEKTKQKIKNRVNLIADRLLELYAKRQMEKGFAFKEDDELQMEFEKLFPFQLTDDQIKALDEIKGDMEKPYPMDRLLCGDVGFGKTEVAFRAAFKAILSGKQVALLCPTTLLARQHFERASERFELFGVKIALFSRFVKDSVQKQQIQDIKDGKVHLIIGTHRLLSKEIQIPNLGLLIVDEEQRFGVEHKERIKEISTNIDVLTLTATPIPRTLQMSLLGIRNLSQIQHAPLNRMPIQTYVTGFSWELVKDVIERELGRNGQAFFLHNNVSSIYHTASKIQKLVPESSIAVVHGKMDKEVIEETMERFYSGEINVLVCTSIIETGLDIPNANTIIIEDADHFGLSQLYQIKGRVGRSNKIAYAYLLYKQDKIINEDAQKRLKAIKDFTELGSGYKIAQRDLTIRGAGDILGPEQAGFIDSVGIDMYIRLVNEVMNERKNKVKEKEERNVISNVAIDGYIPNKYVSDSDKVSVYKDIQEVTNIASLETLRNKIIDIYGKMPKEVDLLLKKRKIDILAAHPFIENMYEEGDVVIIILSEDISQISKIGIILFERLGIIVKYLRVAYLDRRIKIRLKKVTNYIDVLEQTLMTITTLSN